MNSGRSNALSGLMSGLACAAATRNPQTDVAFGRTAEVRHALAGVGFIGCRGRSIRVIPGWSTDRTWLVAAPQVLIGSDTFQVATATTDARGRSGRGHLAGNRE